MIVWAIANPILFYFYRQGNENSFKKVSSIVFSLFSIACISIYFIDYTSPSGHPGIIKGLTDPLRSFHFFILWIWCPFLNGLTYPKFACIPLALFHCFLIILFRKDLKSLITRKTVLTSFQFLMLCLILYGLGSGLITAIGRSGFGVKAALYVQYPSFALWTHIGIFGLLLSLKKEVFTKVNIVFLSIYGTIFAISFEDSVTKLYSWKNTFTQAALCVQYIDTFPDNPVLRYMHPAPQLIPRKAKLFKSKSIIKDTSNEWLLDENIKIKDNGGSFSINTTAGTIMIHGWGCNGENKNPADFVVLFDYSLDGTKTPILITNLDKKRKDVARSLGVNNSLLYGFHHHLPFEKKLSSPKMYSVDVKSKTLFQLVKID